MIGLATVKALPWRLIGIVAGVVALVLGVLWVGARVRVSYVAEHQRDVALEDLATEREQNAANIGAIALDISDNEKERGELVGRLDKIDARFDGLQLNVPAPEKLVQRTEVPNEPCPRDGLSVEFVGVYNAPATEAGSAEAETR